jgi:flagellar biosynthesis/type III secretory pathway M-ring protein FliF/YscJ
MKKEGISTVYSVIFWLAVLLVLFLIIINIMRKMAPAGGAA